MIYNNFGRFVLYFSLVSLTTAIAGPFFAVYILKNLGFSYVQYMTIILSNSIAALLFISPWGKFTDRYGSIKTIKITGFLTPLIPFLWVCVIFLDTSYIFSYLIVLEVFSGIVWAGFNLAAGNFIYDAVTRQRLAICVSYFSILSGLGVLIGATLGGIISSYNLRIFGLNSILFVFLLSGVARLIVYTLMIPKIQEVRNVGEFNIKNAREKIKNLSVQKFFEYMDININLNFSKFKPF